MQLRQDNRLDAKVRSTPCQLAGHSVGGRALLERPGHPALAAPRLDGVGRGGVNVTPGNTFYSSYTDDNHLPDKAPRKVIAYSL